MFGGFETKLLGYRTFLKSDPEHIVLDLLGNELWVLKFGIHRVLVVG
jgi:hypothetical protein